MNSIAIAFVLINAVLLITLPRKWAPLPLLIGACYMTLDQGVYVGTFYFSVIRLLILAGVCRVVVRREWLLGGLNGLDKMMLVWGAWALISSAFHNDPSATLENHLGLVYNTCGIYFFVRILLQSGDDLVGIFSIMAILLAPVAAEMLYEELAGHNLFSIFGGVPESPAIREGSIRAQGPFHHAILAGTVGAVCLPLVIGLWRQYRKIAVLGIVACVTMVITCSSSGPIMSALAGIGALFMWRFRDRMKVVRYLAVLGYIGLDIIMKSPVYFIMARIDVAGGSKGWHRAALIQGAFNHLNEWWLAGTDYTRHWMPTGVSWSGAHTDITNYYLKMGVIGGLPLMISLIVIFGIGFSYIGKLLKRYATNRPEAQFMLWVLGASLFAHAATCISVSYFDQSYIFLYMDFSIISFLWCESKQFEFSEKESIS